MFFWGYIKVQKNFMIWLVSVIKFIIDCVKIKSLLMIWIVLQIYKYFFDMYEESKGKGLS